MSFEDDLIAATESLAASAKQAWGIAESDSSRFTATVDSYQRCATCALMLVDHDGSDHPFTTIPASARRTAVEPLIPRGWYFYCHTCYRLSHTLIRQCEHGGLDHPFHSDLLTPDSCAPTYPDHNAPHVQHHPTCAKCGDDYIDGRPCHEQR